MLKILPINEKEKVNNFYQQKNLIYNDSSGMIVASLNDETLGYATFDLFDDKIIITDIFPLNDIMLADGILRSALHIADFRGVKEAFYNNEKLTSLLNKLGFIKNTEKMSIKIEKLHESCCGC